MSPSAFASLASKFKGDRRHLFVVPQPIVAYLALNTQRPLFRDNPQLRRAVNYALNRPILARLFGERGAVPVRADKVAALAPSDSRDSRIASL